MALSIPIKMMGKEGIENVALSGNVVTESSIRHAFLLPPDAIVKLTFETNGIRINCGTQSAPEHSFLLPNGYSTMTFVAESNRAPSRRATSMDTSQTIHPVYIPIETDALTHQLEKYLFHEKNDTKSCFTIISSHHAVSFNHGAHQCWNSIPPDNQTSVIICNQEEQEFHTQVIACNADMDFVVVHSEVPLVSGAPTISFPRKLERYILLGYPKANSSYEALEGTFASVKLDSKGRMRGSSGSQRGYSGGPVFNYRGELLGINVAHESPSKSIGSNGQSTMYDVVFNELSAAVPSLSVIVPVYCLAMGIKENLRFEQ